MDLWIGLMARWALNQSSGSGYALVGFMVCGPHWTIFMWAKGWGPYNIRSPLDTWMYNNFKLNLDEHLNEA